MNALRHLEVLRRHHRIVAIGAILGIVLAVLALYKPGSGGLEPRTPPVYAADSKLIVTQEGFPWGRGALPGVNADITDENGNPAISEEQTRFVDPGRFAYLAWIYSHFLTGDEVTKMLAHRPAGMEILANPIMAGGGMSADALPLIHIRTMAHSPADAQRLNADAIDALETYIEDHQNAGDVPDGERVELQIVNRSLGASLVKGKQYSLAVAAFALTLAAAIALAFLLDTLRRRRDLDEVDLLVAREFEDARVSRLERTAS